MVSDADDALVTELAELAAASLGWDWSEETTGDVRYPSGPDTIRPEVEVILHRLLELGWRAPARPAPVPGTLDLYPPVGRIP